MTETVCRQTYRLRVSRSVEAALITEHHAARYVWNELVSQARRVHRANREMGWTSDHPDYLTFGSTQQSRYLTGLRERTPWLREHSSVVQQQTQRIFAAARTRALTTPRIGLPRYKSRKRTLPSLAYTTRGFTVRDIDGRTVLALAGGLAATVVVNGWPLKSTPTSVTVYQDSIGHWYASFVTRQTITPDDIIKDDDGVGIDWGVSTIATTTDPQCDEPVHQFQKNAQSTLTRYQRMMSRRRPARGHEGSRRYKHAKRLAAKQHKKIARQRKDAANKWAVKVTAHHQNIAVEDLKPKFMSSNRSLAHTANDNAIATYKSALQWQATKRGRDLRLINPKHSTMECSSCHAITKHRLPLSQRIYTCETCGLTLGRDLNAAHVIRQRAGFNPEVNDGHQTSSVAVHETQS